MFSCFGRWVQRLSDRVTLPCNIVYVTQIETHLYMIYRFIEFYEVLTISNLLKNLKNQKGVVKISYLWRVVSGLWLGAKKRGESNNSREKREGRSGQI